MGEVTCPHCGGSGTKRCCGKKECRDCKGSGTRTCHGCNGSGKVQG